MGPHEAPMGPRSHEVYLSSARESPQISIGTFDPRLPRESRCSASTIGAGRLRRLRYGRLLCLNSPGLSRRCAAGPPVITATAYFRQRHAGVVV